MCNEYLYTITSSISHRIGLKYTTDTSLRFTRDGERETRFKRYQNYSNLLLVRIIHLQLSEGMHSLYTLLLHTLRLLWCLYSENRVLKLIEWLLVTAQPVATLAARYRLASRYYSTVMGYTSVLVSCNQGGAFIRWALFEMGV